MSYKKQITEDFILKCLETSYDEMINSGRNRITEYPNQDLSS